MPVCGHPAGVPARRRLTAGRQTDRPYPLIGGPSPPPGSGRRRHGPDLNKQAQHIRLGETLDDTVAADLVLVRGLKGVVTHCLPVLLLR
jgi:hypothetical protein